MNLSKWRKHHWGGAVFVVVGLFAATFYWGQASQAQAACIQAYPKGAHIQATTNMPVYATDIVTTKGVQCVQPAGATGIVASIPQISQKKTWLKITWDSYCSGWSVISAPLTVVQ